MYTCYGIETLYNLKVITLLVIKLIKLNVFNEINFSTNCHT